MPVATSNISVKTADGLAVYAVFRHVSDLTAWNTFTIALEAFQAGHWYSGGSNNYAVAATKTVQSANIAAEYAVEIPSLPAGVYFAELYVQQGATPAATDGQPSWVVQDIAWNGFAILPSINASGNEVVDIGSVQAFNNTGQMTALPVSVSITPLQGTFINPQQVVVNFVVTQYSAQSFVWVLTDASGNPVNLSGKTVAFRAADRFGKVIVSYGTVSTPGNIAVSGTGHNDVTVTFAIADTATAEPLAYTLWNVTDSLPLASGTCKIDNAIAPS